jgi:hypothetical protein
MQSEKIATESTSTTGKDPRIMKNCEELFKREQ